MKLFLIVFILSIFYAANVRASIEGTWTYDQTKHQEFMRALKEEGGFELLKRTFPEYYDLVVGNENLEIKRMNDDSVVLIYPGDNRIEIKEMDDGNYEGPDSEFYRLRQVDDRLTIYQWSEIDASDTFSMHFKRKPAEQGSSHNVGKRPPLS